MIEIICIVGIGLFATVLWLFLRSSELSWGDSPSRPITPTPRPHIKIPDQSAMYIRIEKYLEEVRKEQDRSNRSDKAEVCEMLFKLKNRWKIIRLYASSFPVNSKLAIAHRDRDALEIELMDRGIDLKYPN